MYVCVCVCVCVCVSVCMCVYVRARACVSVYMCMRGICSYCESYNINSIILYIVQYKAYFEVISIIASMK